MRVVNAAVVLALLALPAAALAVGHITGSFQGWNPDDPNYELTQNANGVYTLTKTLDAGTHEYKAVDGNAWGQDFPSANQTFTFGASSTVTWYVNFGAVVGTKQGDEYVFHSMNPPIVCGSFMSELGGTDWDQTNTTLTVMSDPDGDDVWEFQSLIPAGSYQFKIVLNNNWNQDTYPPSQNYSFGSDGVTPVLFRYHMVNNVTEVFTSAPPMVEQVRVPAACPQDAWTLEVKFSKAVEETSAETTTNYWVSGGYSVVSATRDPVNNDIVVLEVSPNLVAGFDYQVVVTGVTDLDGQPVDPENDDGCFHLYQVIFEVNMHVYIQEHAVPTSVHIQGDTYPLTWDACGGCEAYDDGQGLDIAAGDSTYTVGHYFSMIYDCGGSAVEAQAKYKYVVDCTTWEGAYDFGHFVTLDPAGTNVRVNVWWEDHAPADYTTCDVQVRFQVTHTPACTLLGVRGSVSPLSWDTDATLVDDGTGGDLVSGDGVYSALLTFPTGSYRYLEYKYACDAAYECGTFPNRTLTLDDVNHCVGGGGPMEVLDLWDWCAPVSTVPDEPQAKSWGQIKSLYR